MTERLHTRDSTEVGSIGNTWIGLSLGIDIPGKTVRLKRLDDHCSGDGAIDDAIFATAG